MLKLLLTSTASERIKKAIKIKNSPFTKPAITSARAYLKKKLNCVQHDKKLLHNIAWESGTQ